MTLKTGDVPWSHTMFLSEEVLAAFNITYYLLVAAAS